MAENKGGFIYILTNPSFPQFVKIGYANDIKSRLKQLNRSECVPFAFRVYGYYKIPKRLTDVEIHKIIDTLNPNLRAIEYVNGKQRKREFYEMTASDAFEILLSIAKINGCEKDVHLEEPTKEDMENETKAEESTTRSKLPKMDWLIEQGVVNIGDEIHVINHPEEIAEIVDKDNVCYKGKTMSFNKFGCKVTGWSSIQSYAYMKRVNDSETLSELRLKKMNEVGYNENK